MKRRLARPRSIIWFGRLYFAAILLRPLNLYLAWPGFRFQVRANFPDWPVEAVLLLIAVVILVQLILGWLAARRRSRVAAVLIALWTLFAVTTFVIDLARRGLDLGPDTLVGMLIALLAAGAMAMLLLPESRRWFSGQPGFPIWNGISTDRRLHRHSSCRETTSPSIVRVSG